MAMSPKIMKKPAGLGKDDIKIQVHIWQGVKKYECESVLFEKKQTFGDVACVAMIGRRNYQKNFQNGKCVLMERK